MKTENKNEGVVLRPQPRQREFMRRPEPEALYGGAAGGGVVENDVAVLYLRLAPEGHGVFASLVAAT